MFDSFTQTRKLYAQFKYLNTLIFTQPSCMKNFYQIYLQSSQSSNKFMVLVAEQFLKVPAETNMIFDVLMV